VLFIAHREEILAQSMRTFRTIRPTATFGYYTGQDKAPDADVLFASIQTLGRQAHLKRFDPRRFDRRACDSAPERSRPEAARPGMRAPARRRRRVPPRGSQSYRRVIAWFELTSCSVSPPPRNARTAWDLLTLCGDNLVYRCDVAEGIRRGLLCPFEERAAG